MTRFFANNGLSYLLLGLILHLFLQSATAAAPAPAPAEISSKESISLYLFLQSATAAAPAPAPAPPPAESSSKARMMSEIECYALPYGGLGFLSHILAYYTFACIGVGLKPLMPWEKSTGGTWNLFLAVVQLIASNAIAIITTNQCRNEWPIAGIIVSEAFSSATLGIVTIHRAILDKSHEDSWDPFAWLMYYAIGAIIGTVGLISLVIQTWDDFQAVKDVTYAFVSVALFISFLCASQTVISKEDGVSDLKPWDLFLVTIVVSLFYLVLGMGLFVQLYSDLVLGVVSGNLAGVPSGSVKVILFSIYFVSKRLPMLTL